MRLNPTWTIPDLTWIPDSGIGYWIRRAFKRWIYPHSTQILVLRGGVDHDHYHILYDWVREREPNYLRRVWLVFDHMGIDKQLNQLFLRGEIRFQSHELHTEFLLRFPVDMREGYAII